MKLKAKTTKTPAGTFSAPLNPSFEDKLKKCKTNEDLFKLVDIDGFIDPDAFNEVRHRGLYPEYSAWKKSKHRTSNIERSTSNVKEEIKNCNHDQLVRLGFVKVSDKYELQGIHQKFIVCTSDLSKNDTWLFLSKYSKLIDNRKFSSNRGKPYINRIKDCRNIESLKNALKKFDVPENQYQYFIGGAEIKKLVTDN